MQNLSSISQLPEVVNLNLDVSHEYLEVSMRINGQQDSQKVSLSAFASWLQEYLFSGGYVDLKTNQTINGIKTFNSTPHIATAAGSNETDAVNVAYLNTMIADSLEQWQFTLDDGSTYSKYVLAKDSK